MLLKESMKDKGTVLIPYPRKFRLLQLFLDFGGETFDGEIEFYDPVDVNCVNYILVDDYDDEGNVLEERICSYSDRTLSI